MGEETRFDRRTALAGALAAAGGAAIATALPGSATAKALGPAGRRHGGSGGPGLRARGMGYESGALAPVSPTMIWGNRPHFDPRQVKREMRIIRDVLNCNAVRIEGSDQDRLETCATIATDLGLEAWYSPWPMNQQPEEMLAFLAESAKRCERLRRRGRKVVLTTGSELFITMPGFVPGDYYPERVEYLKNRGPNFPVVIAQLPGKVNAFLAQAAAVARANFKGPISYAGISIERVDWTPFDIVSEDFFPGLVNGEYVGAIATIEALKSHGKPVAITEMACGTFDGAAANPLAADDLVIRDANGLPTGLKEPVVRDEAEQAEYLTGLLALFEEDGVDSAFVYTLCMFEMTTDELDLASWGITKSLGPKAHGGFRGAPWRPKQAFWDVAEFYARCRRR